MRSRTIDLEHWVTVCCWGHVAASRTNAVGAAGHNRGATKALARKPDRPDECDGGHHPVCVGMESVPEGGWVCAGCVARSFVSNACEDEEEDDEAMPDGDSFVDVAKCVRMPSRYARVCHHGPRVCN